MHAVSWKQLVLQKGQPNSMDGHHLLLLDLRPRFWQGTAARLGKRMCHICKLASINSVSETAFYTGDALNTTYSNVWPDAGWRGSTESHEEFQASLPIKNKLATSPYFRNFMMWNDPLHVMYRGILLSYVGSVLAHMAGCRFWVENGDMESNLSVAHDECNDWCGRCKLGYLSVDNFTTSNLSSGA